METKTAATIFEVLTSEARLSIFRLLVKYAPNGLVAGEISRMLDIPKTNLSFHLKAIVHSGLAEMEREGRNTRYKANIPLMLETTTYLTAECCSGDSEPRQTPCSECGAPTAHDQSNNGGQEESTTMLTAKEKELVAIGSAIGGNCIPCLEWHYKKCVALGFNESALKEAITVAKTVKEVPNKKIYETAERLLGIKGAPDSLPSCS